MPSEKIPNLVSSGTLKLFPSIGKFKNHDIETKQLEKDSEISLSLGFIF